MNPVAFALVAVLALATPGEAGAPAAEPARVRTVAGKLGAVRLGEGSAALRLRTGELRLLLDRNTAVFLPGRQGTLLDLVEGEPARASVGPDGRASWIELHPRGVVPTGETGELEAPERAAPPPPAAR